MTPPVSGWSAWQTDPALVPDYEWIEVEVTLRGDGLDSPEIAAKGVKVAYKCFQPVLLREDRTSFPGGIYIGGDTGSNLQRPLYLHGSYDTETPGGRALARATADRVGRLRSFVARILTKETEDELSRDQLARDNGSLTEVNNLAIESPFDDLVMKVRPYDVSEIAPEFDYERLRESVPARVADAKAMSFESTMVLESGPLST